MLTKLELDAPVYLASDIHLGPAIPQTNQAFYDFLQRIVDEAESLILMGDIFNYWIGDDIAIHHPEPWLTEAINHLQAYASKKPLYLMHGNRDFLLGKRFAELLGATLLPEQILLSVGEQCYHLSHGDELCTHDRGFMRFRYWTRQAWLKRLFFTLPMSWRIKIAQKARQHSKNKQAATTYQAHFGEVNPEELTQLVQRLPHITGIIHGHTHQPCNNVITAAEQTYRYVVLPDWELDHANTERSGYGVIHKNGLQLFNHWNPNNESTLTNALEVAERP